jgi:hypothetical protein
MSTQQLAQEAFMADRDAKKADTARRLRITLAAGFMGELAGDTTDKMLREAAKQALRAADILIEEAGKAP